MIRNFKALGLMAVAALAMSAMFAAGAQAQAGTFTAGATPETHTATNIHGAQYGGPTANFFQAGAAEEKVTCQNSGVTYTGSDADGTATSLTITPSYKDCYTFTGATHAEDRPATVTMNGCDYKFNQPSTVGGVMTGTANLECNPSGGEVVVEIYQFGTMTSHSFKVCEISVEEFTNKGTVTYTNSVTPAGKDDVTVSANVTGIPYTEHGLCAAGATTKTDGVFQSTVTVTGQLSGNPHDVWVSE